MKNWKTTATAIIAALVVVLQTASNLLSGQPVQWEVVIPALITALGLLLAKDFNVTGK